ncbi:MAG: protein kinase [Longimicrobiales bacterium]|nr:protein kinase [Longimicrobiales bacterium]
MIGGTFGHYRILEKIGQGGMGEVFLADDTSLQRKVALKFLPSALAESDEFRERFLVEAQAAAALSHPNICVIHEVGEADLGEAGSRPFIAMEYVAGETLQEKIRRFLELEVWSRVPDDQLGAAPDKQEKEEILGYGANGV